MFRRPGASHALFHFASDICLTIVALFLSTILRPLLPFGRPLTAEHAQLSPVIYALVALIWGVAFLLLSVYVPRTLRAVDEAQFISVAVTVATLILAGVLYFSYREISRLQILTFYILDLACLIGYRFIARLSLRLMNQPRYAIRKVLILGAGEAGRDVLGMIRNHEWTGLEPVGFLDDSIPSQSEVEGYPVLGGVAEVAQHIEAEGVSEIVVALPLGAYDRFFSLIAELQELPARVRIVPDHIKTTLFRTVVDEFAGVPMLTLKQPTLDPFERQVKRTFDLVVGAISFILALPMMALIAIAIRLDSPGPAVFKQQRVGENGKLFWMYKFRSMVAGAEDQLEQLISFTEDGRLLFKHPDDPRVTRVGKFLRRFSLDEVPQLVNVLKGEMSLVGPRPELPWIVEHYEPWQWQRLAVPQGLTGWWQVNGRSDKPMHLHTEEDLYYIQNYTLLLDVQILWSTIGAVLEGRGAF